MSPLFPLQSLGFLMGMILEAMSSKVPVIKWVWFLSFLWSDTLNTSEPLKYIAIIVLPKLWTLCWLYSHVTDSNRTTRRYIMLGDDGIGTKIFSAILPSNSFQFKDFGGKTLIFINEVLKFQKIMTQNLHWCGWTQSNYSQYWPRFLYKVVPWYSPGFYKWHTCTYIISLI